MANRFFVGNGSNWSSTASWSTSTGGASGAAVPTTADAVFLDANSPGNLTVDAAASCLSLDCTGFTHTVTHAAAATLTVAGATFKLVAGMTYTLGDGNTSALAFTQSGAGTVAITTGGKTLGSVTTASGLSSSSATYQMQDDCTIGTTATWTHNAGTLDTNGKTCSWGKCSSSNSNVRTVTLGASAVALTSSATGTIWNFATSTGLTFTAGTSTITVTTSSSNTRTFAGGGQSYGTVTYTVANSPGQLQFTGANTIGTLNVNSAKQVQFPASTTNTVTNFNVAGANAGGVYLPGVAANYVSTPDAAPLKITGDIDVRWYGALDNWATGALQVLVSKFSTTREYMLCIESTNKLTFYWSTDGTTGTQVGISATSVTGFTTHSASWVRATLAVATGTCTLYTSSDGVTWTQVGQTVHGATSIFNGTEDVELGARSSGTLSFAAGIVYRAQIYNGIAGTLVFDANFATKTVGANTFTESSTNAATVTINGVLAQAGDGRVAITSSTPGTKATLSTGATQNSCDYLTIQDSAATTTGGLGWYAGDHSVSVSNNTGWNFFALILGTVSLSGTASLTATALVTALATITETGVAGLSASSSVTASASITEVGTGTLTPAALVTAFGAVTETGEGALTATAQVTVSATVTLDGTGNLAASAAAAVFATVLETGAAALTPAAIITQFASTALAGVGQLDAAAAAVTEQASVALAGAGNLSAVGAATVTAAVNLTGVGALTASGVTPLLGTVLLAGNASLHAAAITFDPNPVTFVASAAYTTWSSGTAHSTWSANPSFSDWKVGAAHI